ncbi:MAG TPA: glycosyltransferase family 4 protein [Candidatus Paceibacterota bacterium]
MRILFLNYEFPPLGGGASPSSFALARRYVAFGHDVDVVTMCYKGLPKREVMDGIRVFRVPSFRAKKEICHIHEMVFYVVSAIWFLRKHMKNARYDVCHAHFIVPTGIVALWVKRKYQLPYVLTAHGSDISGYNPDRFIISHRFLKPILRAVCTNAKAIVAPSHFLRKLLLKSVRGAENKLSVIPNGIDSDQFVQKQKKNLIISTGRLLPRKGFQYLIKAVSDKDTGYEVHILGDGPMMRELRAMAKVSKTKIIFHGWLNNDSEGYKNLLGHAAIYCLCSLQENSSVALLEAMSAGCAVITTNISGCAETVGDAGVTVPPQDTAALQATLVELIDNSRMREAFQQKARLRAINYFDWNTIAGNYERLLTNTNSYIMT